MTQVTFMLEGAAIVFISRASTIKRHDSSPGSILQSGLVLLDPTHL